MKKLPLIVISVATSLSSWSLYGSTSGVQSDYKPKPKTGVMFAGACQYNANAICTEEGKKELWACAKSDSEGKPCGCRNCGIDSGICKSKACRKK